MQLESRILLPLTLKALLKKVLNRVRRIGQMPVRAIYNSSARIRNKYWEIRAGGIHIKWGMNEEDFPVLEQVIYSLA